MTSVLPPPPVPQDLDLRDFQYMPLDVVRLVDSDLTAIASGEEFRAAVILWCKSWHQIPASSLPNDDRLLAHLAGFGRDIKAWKAVREMALRGFSECSDGRLYHPVVAEKALEAGESKREHREAQEADKARKQRERDDRSRMFEELKAAGVTAKWNTPTSQLRDMVTNLSTVTSGVTGHGQSQDSHAPVTEPVTTVVTANKGEGKGKGRERDNIALTSENARAEDQPEEPKAEPEHLTFAKRTLANHIAEIDDWEISFLETIKHTDKPTKAQREKLDALRAKIGHHEAAKATAAPPPRRIAVREGSPAWEAWRATGKRFPTVDLKDDEGRVIGRGWYFETEFPPSEAAA